MEPSGTRFCNWPIAVRTAWLLGGGEALHQRDGVHVDRHQLHAVVGRQRRQHGVEDGQRLVAVHARLAGRGVDQDHDFVRGRCGSGGLRRQAQGEVRLTLRPV